MREMILYSIRSVMNVRFLILCAFLSIAVVSTGVLRDLRVVF